MISEYESLLISSFKELEEDFSSQQIIYALEDGNYLKECHAELNQFDVEFLHDFYTKKLESEKA